MFGPDKKAEGGENIILADLIAIIRDIRQRGGQLKDIVLLVRGGKEGELTGRSVLSQMIRCTSGRLPIYNLSSPF